MQQTNQQNANFAQAPQQQRAPQQRPSSPSGNGLMGKVLIIVLVLVVALGAVWVARGQGWFSSADTSTSPNSSLYQAVFLTNGQVYFGKLHLANRGKVVLTDVFYLQVVEPLQQQQLMDAEGIEGMQQLDEDEPQINLVKLGSEIHGPTDKIVIPIHSVVFWEDLQSEGTVSLAIEEYKNNPPEEETQN